MRTRVLVAGLVVSSAITPIFAWGLQRDVHAGPPPATAVPIAPAEAPTAASLAGLMDRELHWGMTHAQVIDIYVRVNGVIDHDYASTIARMQPGVAMETVVIERDNRKSTFERSFQQFEVQSGYDALPIHAEFTYKNNESALEVRRDNKHRYFFFIRDRLWKTYDEITLSEDGPLGATFDDAVDKVGDALGIAGRDRAADITPENEFATVDWQDATSHLRMIDRSSEHIVGVVMEDRATLRNLPTLRVYKPSDPFALDPIVAALSKRGGVSDPSAAAERPDAGATTPRR